MRSRKRMRRGASRRYFRKTSGVHRRNRRRRSMRGGRRI